MSTAAGKPGVLMSVRHRLDHDQRHLEPDGHPGGTRRDCSDAQHVSESPASHGGTPEPSRANSHPHRRTGAPAHRYDRRPPQPWPATVPAMPPKQPTRPAFKAQRAVVAASPNGWYPAPETATETGSSANGDHTESQTKRAPHHGSGTRLRRHRRVLAGLPLRWTRLGHSPLEQFPHLLQHGPADYLGVSVQHLNRCIGVFADDNDARVDRIVQDSTYLCGSPSSG